jgi:hypothetical protein
VKRQLNRAHSGAKRNDLQPLPFQSELIKGVGPMKGSFNRVAIGALSDPRPLNLGDPWWRDHGGDTEYHRRCDHS